MLHKVLWNSLLATPAVVGAALLVSSSAIAAEATVSTDADALLNDLATASEFKTTTVSGLTADVAPAQSVVSSQPQAAAPVQLAQMPVDQQPATTVPAAPVAPAPMAPAATPAPAAPGVDSLQQVIQYSNEGASQAQVTSISQLSDVQPTDWAFQALQSLVERYGCIAGYPDGTYRGNRAMTRYEFAAGLNACLDRISELIAQTTADLATKEDLATLQRLQEEFAAELATLRGRVDSLEARTAELEANQFSTTTKLRGETIFAVATPFGQDEEAFRDEQTTLGYRVRLNFDTSFSGDDLLRARLEANNIVDFASLGNTIGFADSFTYSTGRTDLDDVSDDGRRTNVVNNNIRIADLYYTFPVGERVQLTVAANGVTDSDWVVSTVSPFDSDGQGSISEFGGPPQYNFIPGGAGAGFNIQLSDNLSLDAAYAGAEANDPSAGAGLFNGDYGIIAQLTYLSDSLDAALTYGNGYQSAGFGPSGQAEVANTYGAQVNFKVSSGFQIGGGVAYIPIRTIGEGDYQVWSYQGTLAFPDLGGEGNLLGFLAGVPPRIARASDGVAGLGPVSAALGGRDRQDAAFLVEGFYRLKVNDNISITPGVIWISDPGNNNGNDDTFVGALRTTFTF